MFVMRVLGHDTALMTQTDDFIFYFRIAFISALLARSLSAMTPLHSPPPLIFCHIIFKQLNNQSFPSLHGIGQACFRTRLQQKKMSFTGVLDWHVRAERCLLHHPHCVARRGQQLLKAQISPVPSSFLLGSHWGRPGRKGKVMGDTRKPPFIFCRDLLALPSSLCVMGPSPGPVGISHKSLVSNQLRFSLTCWPTCALGLQFFSSLHTSALTIAEYRVTFTPFLYFYFRLLFKFLPPSVFLHDFDYFYFRF